MWERKKLIYYSLRHRFPTKKSILQKKEVFESKCFFFGWCQNIHILSPSLWHNILILWAWATMYEFNLHNILYKNVFVPRAWFSFLNNLDLLRLWLFRKLFHIWTSWMLMMPFWNSSLFATKPHDSPLEIAQLDIEQITGIKTEMSS